MFIVFCKAKLATVLLFALEAFPAYADPYSGPGEFQIIVTQELGKTVGINIAHGRGDDVRFFSNISDEDVEWDQGNHGVRVGQYNGQTKDVQLGVCVGVNCQAESGLGFTTEVGASLH